MAVAPAKPITFSVVSLGILSSVANDAGYLILIPLATAAFVGVGRHPIARRRRHLTGVMTPDQAYRAISWTTGC